MLLVLLPAFAFLYFIMMNITIPHSSITPRENPSGLAEPTNDKNDKRTWLQIVLYILVELEWPYSDHIVQVLASELVVKSRYSILIQMGNAYL